MGELGDGGIVDGKNGGLVVIFRVLGSVRDS